jgi:hypothetical protein
MAVVGAGGIHNVGPDGPNTTIGQLIDNCVRATSSDATRCEWTRISCSPKEFSCQSVAFAGPSGGPTGRHEPTDERLHRGPGVQRYDADTGASITLGPYQALG